MLPTTPPVTAAGWNARLVGENTPGDTVAHAQEHAAHHTAGDGSRLERSLENTGKYRRDLGDVHTDQSQSQQNVQQRHHGYQLLADPADALDATQQNGGYHQADDNANDEIYDFQMLSGEQTEIHQSRIDGGGDGIDLGGVAGAEHGAQAEGGIEIGKRHPFFAKAVFDVVHGAAHIVSGGIALPEVDRQGHFGELGAHAQQSRNPHPEHGARAADGNGAGHTGNVAGAYSGGQGGANRLERGDGAVSGFPLFENPADGGAHGLAEAANLDKSGAKDSGGQGGANRLERGDGAVSGFPLFENPADGGAHGLAEAANLDKSGAKAQVSAYTQNADHGRHAPDEFV